MMLLDGLGMMASPRAQQEGGTPVGDSEMM